MALCTIGSVRHPAHIEDLLSERARAYILSRWIDVGAEWLDGLPGRVEHLLQEWELRPIATLDAGRSCVLTVRTPEGEPGVLKISVLERWATREAIALRHWSLTRHSPCVHRSGEGAIVLEQIQGRHMTRADGDLLPAVAQMIAAAARNEAPPPGIPRLDPHRNLAAASRRAGARLPERWAVNAAAIASELIGTAPEVLCHADLVPSNILVTNSGRLRLIDPEPRLGPLSYDLSLLAYRFAEGQDFAALADIVARAAGVPSDEVIAWGAVHAYTQTAWRPHLQSREIQPLLRSLDH
jgi:streptomycin 6-kinase